MSTMLDLDKPQIISYIEKPLNYSVYDVKWIPSSAKFVVMGVESKGNGIVQVYTLNSDTIEKVSEFKKAAVKCGTFGASSLRNRHLATGDFQGRLQIWDLSNTNEPLQTYRKHTTIINCIDGIGGSTIGCGAPELVTGSRDGTVMVWDVRCKNEPVAQMRPSEPENKRDCWCVGFGNSYNAEERVVCAGYDNGDVKMFDLKNMSVLWEINVGNGVCGLEFDRKDIAMNKLVVTTLESGVYVFDTRTLHPKLGFAKLTEKAHDSTVWLCKHLPQDREVFITAGGNGTLCLWKYNYPENRVTTNSKGVQKGVVGSLSLLQNAALSTQPIGAFDWSPDKLGLSVCAAFDQTVRVLITTRLNLL